MSTEIHLTARSEAILQNLLATGAYRSVEQVVERALQVLDEKSERAFVASLKMTPAESVATIVENRKSVTLGGLKIRDLISEGRKY